MPTRQPGERSGLAELEYALDVLKLDGVAITSNTQGRYLGHPFFEPIIAELDRRGTPVFVHPTNPPHVTDLALHRPSFLIEFPFDTTRTITNAIYSGVFRRHPGLRLIVAHCGGALPALAWRIASLAAIGRGPHDVHVDADHVAHTLRRLYYDTALSGSASALLAILQITGSDHLLYGTDSGAATEQIMSDNSAGLEALGLSADQLNAIEHGNSTGLFPRLA